MKKLIFIVLISIFDFSKAQNTTICNPLNLSYRHCLDTPSRREAADPNMVVFKNKYYLFASKSGGYWISEDLKNWIFIETKSLPIEEYAPAVMNDKDTLYFMAGYECATIYKSGNPESGVWEIANPKMPMKTPDPAFFIDDDGKIFLYYGCSDKNPIYGVELDPKSLKPIGEPKVLLNCDIKNNGWERNGDYNTILKNPWIEGAWMTKFKNKYYLQYSSPGTEVKAYNDGVYVSDSPLGEFKLSEHNPLSYKPEGFICGAGHSSTFQDKYGNYWHISTQTISVKQIFERRLALFPMFFNEDGIPYVYTGFGDYPFILPNKKISSPEEIFSGLMLLSYNKKVETSSQLPKFQSKNICDESIKSKWVAKSGEKGEWAIVDLGKKCKINAIQINIDEYDSKLLGRSPSIYNKYLIEYSNDKKNWNKLIDKTDNQTDEPNYFTEFGSPIEAQYVKITNYYVPSGNFSLSELRVFGSANGQFPKRTNFSKIQRDTNDKCQVKIKWNKVENATGYNIRYGISPKKLYSNYQVLGSDSLTIRSLSSKQKYFFTIDSFNESGITNGSECIEIK